MTTQTIEYLKFNRSGSAVISNLETAQTITVEGLKIDFSIEKATKTADNKGKITIFNLSESSRGLAAAKPTKSGKQRTHIELRIGYKGQQEKVIFRGTGAVVSIYKAPNWETTFDVTDGVDALDKVTFEKKYPAGAKVHTIIEDITKATGLNLGVNQNITGSLPKARTFSGPIVRTIDELTAKFGFSFTVQDGAAWIREVPQQPNSIYRIKLSRETGLLGSPRAQGDIVLAEALIDPDMKPGNYINLQSLNIDLTGEYVIKKVKFKGSTWAGAWAASLELERSDYNPLFLDATNIQGILA